MFEKADNMESLNKIRVKFLGKKGELTKVLRGMGALSAKERFWIGQLANQVRAELEDYLAARSAEIKDKELEDRLANERLDVTLPGVPFSLGKNHPLTRIQHEIEDIFLGLG